MTTSLLILTRDLRGSMDNQGVIYGSLPIMSLDEKLKHECEEFLSGFESVLLSTLNPDGTPDLSYAPFVDDDGMFYIMASHLSAHTGNLLRSPQAALLFIEDERDCAQIYARRRLRFQCVAEHHPQTSPVWLQMVPKFADRFGEIIETLSALPDFQIFALRPLGGQWIKGFGKAFDFAGRIERDAVHLNPKKENQPR